MRNDDALGTGNLAKHLKRHHKECYRDLKHLKEGESASRVVDDFVKRIKTTTVRQQTLDRHR